MIETVVERICPQICVVNVRKSIFILNNFGLEKFGDVEQDREEGDGEGVLGEPLGVTGDVLDDLVVVDWLVDGNESFKSDSNSCKDGSCHGDMIQGIEKDGECLGVDICLQNIRSESFQRLYHHCCDVENVKSC